MKKVIFVLAIGFSAFAHGGATFIPQAAWVYSDRGASELPTGSLIVFVADFDGDGFGDWAGLSANSFTADPDDVVLGVHSSGGTADGFVSGTYVWNNVTSPNVQGAPVGMLWFDTPYEANFSGAGEQVAFGFFATGETVPADGNSVGASTFGNWFTQDIGGAYPNDTFHAIYETASGGGTTNSAPMMDGIGDRSGDEGQEFTFTITASDTDGDDLTLSVAGLPDGDYFSADPKPSPAAWTFSWTPGEAEDGVYDSVEFTVSDGDLTDSETITITVNEVNTPPVLAGIGDQTVTERQQLSFDLSATDSDLPQDVLTYGTTDLPTGASLDGTTFSWTPVDGQGGQTYDITFTVSDDFDPAGEDSETITVTVNERVNHAPVAEQPDGLVVQAGGTITVPLVATDEDDDVTLSIMSAPVNGALGAIDQETQTVDYTANVGASGEDHFSFQATDGELQSAVIDVYVFITSSQGWLVTLDLQGADFPALYFGADPLATDGYEDTYDELLPGQVPPSRPVGSSFAGLYRPPATDPQSYFLRDIREVDGDYMWVLELDAAADDLTVSWNAGDLPDQVILGITECDANGNPVVVDDGDPLTSADGVPMANMTSLTVTSGDLKRYYCIQPFTGDIEYELQLADGTWNLVSLPLTPAAPAVEDVFSDTNLTAGGRSELRDGRRGVLYSGTVYDWDEAVQDYVVATEIEAYQGYWVYIPEGQGGTITVVGQAAPVPATLHKHWNLIGVGTATTATNPDLALSSIWKWVNGQYDKTTTLMPGLGHWIYSFEDGTSLQSER